MELRGGKRFEVGLKTYSYLFLRGIETHFETMVLPYSLLSTQPCQIALLVVGILLAYTWISCADSRWHKSSFVGVIPTITATYS